MRALLVPKPDGPPAGHTSADGMAARSCAYATPTLLSISAETSANCTFGSAP